MANVNKVILIGNLTQDPELRYTAGQRPVTDLRMAVNRFIGGGEGAERKEEVLFIDVTVWDRQAETACQYLTKGRQVYVEGYLRMDSWDDKESGQKRTKIKVVAQNVQYLDGRREERGAPPQGDESAPPRSSDAPSRSYTPRPAAARSAPVASVVDAGPANDEDIPF